MISEFIVIIVSFGPNINTNAEIGAHILRL
jgi:hypothetical protein